MKKTLSTILALLILAMPVLAIVPDVSEPEEVQLSPDFITLCDDFFSGHGVAYNQDHEDVTDFLYKNYLDVYNRKGYNELHEIFLENGVSQIRTSVETETSNPFLRLVMNRNYSEYVAMDFQQKGFPYDGKKWYLILTAKGSYKYNDGTNQITSFSTPTIGFSFSGLGALFSGHITSSSTTAPVLSSNKRSVTFTTKSTHEVSCPIPGVEYATGTLGPFKGTMYWLVSTY